MRATTSLTGDTVGFDGLRAVVGAGEGVVARFPGIVCVAQCPDPGPLRDFLSLCASAGGPDPGRTLARQLATWMTGSGAPGPELRFGTVAAAGEQMAVFLVGAVEVRVDGAGGVGGLTLSGAHAAIGTDRLFTRPQAPVTLSLDGGQIRDDPAGVYDLQAGVVPGAGVLLHTATFDRDTPDFGTDAGLAAHEWFDPDGPAPAPEQSSWPPDVPPQRTGERNGTTHWPMTAEDDPWGVSALAEPDHEFGREPDTPAELERGVEAASAEGEAGEDGAWEAGAAEDGAARDGAETEVAEGNPAEEDGSPPDGGRGGRHALLFSGNYGAADDAGRDDRDAPDHDAPGRDALDPDVPYGDFADPRDVEAPFESFFADLRNDSRAPLLHTPDPRTGDPPGDAVVEREAGRAAGDSDADKDADRDADRDLTGRPGPVAWPNAQWPNAEWPRADGVDDAADDAADDAGVGDGAARVPSLDQAPYPARTPSTEKEPDVLFAASPRARPRPDARTQAATRLGRPPSPRPAAPRAPADAEPDGTGSDARGADRAGLTPRPRDGRLPGPHGSVGGRALSAAEATSTMPGTLFPSDGEQDGAAALSESPLAEASLSGVAAPSGASATDFGPDPELDPARGGARIRGYRCENGHLNDPRSATCRECGATIDERAGGLVAGQRPPLGRLVFDDGEAHVVDGGYLVGRMPEVDERVRTGELRPIILEDDVGAVSRVHAEIRVSGWDVIVVDTGSRNGTYVSGPDEGIWTALQPRRSRRLLPGARVRMGARMFVFESSSTVR